MLDLVKLKKDLGVLQETHTDATAEDILILLNSKTPQNPHHNFKGETSKVKKIKLLFDDGDFAVADALWEGKPSVVCRWYSEGIGYPQTHGNPTWMVFPKKFGDLIRHSLYFINNIFG